MNTIEQKAQNIFNAMSIEERVGQLFILAFPGKDPKIIADIIDQYGIGGCYISQDNAETFEEALSLTTKLQTSARKKHKELPLILGVDQEGAWGVLIPESTIGPGNLALGRSDDTTHTDTMYRIFAQEMGSVGYQAILGPCSDINLDPKNPIIGTRSFGENAVRVALHVSAAVHAIRSQRLLATAKHFPGHGDTHSDTHRDIPIVDKPFDTLLNEELLPFQAAIDAEVDMIMTAHIIFSQIDPKYPATLSKKILTDLLRKQMNFQGLIITDSMNMGAMRKYYSPEDATVKAFLAGADLIMLSEEHYDHSEQYREKQINSIKSIIDAVQDGRISQEILQDRVMRILQKKLFIQPTTSDVSIALHKNSEMQAAAQAVHVMRHKNNILPLQKDQSIALINTTPQASYCRLMNARGIGPNQANPAFDSFAEHFMLHRDSQNSIDVLLHEKVMDTLIDMLSPYDILIAVTEDYPLPGEDFEKESQQIMVKKIIEAYNNKLIVVGLRSPYELELYSDLQSYICSYSSRTCAAIITAECIACM